MKNFIFAMRAFPLIRPSSLFDVKKDGSLNNEVFHLGALGALCFSFSPFEAFHHLFRD